MSDDKKGIGLISCIGIITGGRIGSATFALSGLTMYNAGPSAIISWILAAAVMLIYGLVCTELAAIFPKSGGIYVFPAKALGSNPKTGAFWGWFSTWGYINSNIAAVAFSAIYVATYLGAGFSLPDGLQVPLALVAILLCFILNCINFRTTGKLQTILVGGLVITLMIYIGVSFFGGEWDPQLMTPFLSQGAAGSTGFLAAVPTAMVGYGSIVAIAFMVSEVKAPNKTVPKAVMISMGIVAAIYCLVVISTLGLISASYLAENPGMQYIPLYAACFTKLAAYPWLTKVVSIAAVLALITTILVVLALTGRAVKAAADDGLVPCIFSKNNGAGVPVFATAVIAIPAAIVACFPDLTSTIVGLGALFGAVSIVVNIFSLYQARKKKLENNELFRAPGGNILPAIALLIIVVCYIPDITSGGWKIWLYTVVWYLVGLVIFYFSKRNRMKE